MVVTFEHSGMVSVEDAMGLVQEELEGKRYGRGSDA